MSEAYQSDVRIDENQNGSVSFATDVIATIAGLAANEIEGVVEMSSSGSGLADVFTRKNARNFTKGVKIELEDNKVNADITMVVDYGSPVPEVAHNIQGNVKKAIETMSGLEVNKVDVHVAGISFEREFANQAKLEEEHKKMLAGMEEAAAESASDESEAVKAGENGDEPQNVEE